MRRLLPVAVALLVVPACGGEEDADEPASGSGGQVVDVTLAEFTIEPSAISLEPGSYTFHVVNDGSTAHALEVEGPSGEVETDDLGPGESADLTVDLAEEGEFEMYCPVGDHHGRGMQGTIAVGSGGGGGGTTTEETTTEDEDEDRGYGY